MDDLGDEKLAELRSVKNDLEKWHYIGNLAAEYGFTGIQLSPKYQNQFGMSFFRIPESVCEEFRITYHLGGLYQLSVAEEKSRLLADISESLQIAIHIGAEDVSLHPPIVKGDTEDQKKRTKEIFHEIVRDWLPRFVENGITLSLETHVTPSVFVFDGIQDYRDFVLGQPGLGVLIDICHNYYDGYEASQLVTQLSSLSITGLHLSDAIRRKELAQGTHLAIGNGEIKFSEWLSNFGVGDNVCGALEVRGPSQGIRDSIKMLRIFAQ